MGPKEFGKRWADRAFEGWLDAAREDKTTSAATKYMSWQFRPALNFHMKAKIAEQAEAEGIDGPKAAEAAAERWWSLSFSWPAFQKRLRVA